MIAVALVVAAIVGLVLATARLPVAPAFYRRPRTGLPSAIILERVRDQRADISAALRRA